MDTSTCVEKGWIPFNSNLSFLYTPTYVEKSLLLYIVSVLFLGLFPRIWEKATHIVKKSSDPQDHSHLRGKKYHEIFYNIFPKGTLPLAWEKVSMFWECLFYYRYTPTCVGKSRLPPVSFYQTWVHSHLRGKKIFISSPCIGCLGLLPLAWEKVYQSEYGWQQCRYTPTRVGKSPPNSNYPELT